MRILGGRAARQRLQVPKGYEVRPTPARVKQALFNSLGPRVLGARVLELFAGSGALGLECLSRGALQLVSVEQVQRHAEFLRGNLAALGPAAAAVEVRVQDVFSALPQLVAAGRDFDLVFADPPFGDKNLGRRSTSCSQRLLDDAHLPRTLAPGGWLLLGHAHRDVLTVPPAWIERKVMRHGDSVFRFLEPAQPGPA